MMVKVNEARFELLEMVVDLVGVARMVSGSRPEIEMPL